MLELWPRCIEFPIWLSYWLHWRRRKKRTQMGVSSVARATLWSVLCLFVALTNANAQNPSANLQEVQVTDGAFSLGGPSSFMGRTCRDPSGRREQAGCRSLVRHAMACWRHHRSLCPQSGHDQRCRVPEHGRPTVGSICSPISAITASRYSRAARRQKRRPDIIVDYTISTAGNRT
jgi:hypothetical protein